MPLVIRQSGTLSCITSITIPPCVHQVIDEGLRCPCRGKLFGLTEIIFRVEPALNPAVILGDGMRLAALFAKKYDVSQSRDQD